MEEILIEKKDNIYLIKLVGELILETIEEIKPKIEECILDQDWDKLAIDLSEVQFLDSSGIGFLVALSNRIKQQGKKFFLLNPSKQVIKTLKLVNIYHFFEVVEDIDEVEIDLD